MRWEWLSLLLGFVLISALFLPGSSSMLGQFDVGLFSFLNGSLTSGSFVSELLGILNSRYVELLAQIAMIGLFYLGCRDVRTTLFSTAVVSVFVCLVHIVMEQGVFGALLDLKRFSPSLVVHPSVLLGNEIYSLGTFPPSYATTLAIATLWIFRESGRRYGWYAVGVMAIMVVPKLFAGFHGLSDLIFGTGGLICLVAPLLSYIPPYQIEGEACQNSY